jgi:hypothetical protein
MLPFECKDTNAGAPYNTKGQNMKQKVNIKTQKDKITTF